MNKEYVDIVFDGGPGPVSGRFVEAERPDGCSIRVGEWIDRGNGLWALRIPYPGVNELPSSADAPKAEKAVTEYINSITYAHHPWAVIAGKRILGYYATDMEANRARDKYNEEL